MADLNRMDRTWLCSVLFMDIVQYSSQSVEVQMKWKKRFNGYLMEAIQAVPENERIILDTGDGLRCRLFLARGHRKRLCLRHFSCVAPSFWTSKNSAWVYACAWGSISAPSS